MKHTVISAACILLVVVYSFFTLGYVSEFKNQIDTQLSDPNNTVSAEDCETIKNIYESKKNVLRFILNNDYTDQIEEIIIGLENAVKHRDYKDIDIYRQLLESVTEEIMHKNKCII
ncbi:MAG: DUF4363 family protein [Ruminococcaceae bacterium]|nr:DUF4363 family protein [Oscillospiraceae bacterium]